jgi:hypothetical protein
MSALKPTLPPCREIFPKLDPTPYDPKWGDHPWRKGTWLNINNQSTNKKANKKDNSGHEPTHDKTTKEHTPHHLNSESSTSPLHMLKKTQEETKKIKETIKPNYHKGTRPPLTDANLKPRSPTLNHKVHLKLPQNTEKEK